MGDKVMGEGDPLAPEKKSRRRMLIVAAVLGAAAIAYGGAAYADPAGDMLLADLVTNSITALGQGTEIIKQVQQAATIARETADMAQRVANTAKALRNLNMQRIVERAKEDLEAAYPEVTSAYYTVANIGKEKGLIDWSITYCGADAILAARGMSQNMVVDPQTGEVENRGGWCSRFLQSADGQLMTTAYRLMQNQPIEAQIAALGYQRARLVADEDNYRFRLCLQRNVTICAGYCSGGPDLWKTPEKVMRMPCPKPQDNSAALPKDIAPTIVYQMFGKEPEQKDPHCPNPFTALGAEDRDDDNHLKVVCEKQTQAAYFGAQQMQLEEQLAASRNRQIVQIDALVADAKVKDEQQKRLQAQMRMANEGLSSMEAKANAAGAAGSDGQAPAGAEEGQ
jgi:hypothetical protein